MKNTFLNNLLNYTKEGGKIGFYGFGIFLTPPIFIASIYTQMPIDFATLFTIGTPMAGTLCGGIIGSVIATSETIGTTLIEPIAQKMAKKIYKPTNIQEIDIENRNANSLKNKVDNKLTPSDKLLEAIAKPVRESKVIKILQKELGPIQIQKQESKESGYAKYISENSININGSIIFVEKMNRAEELEEIRSKENQENSQKIHKKMRW